MTNFLSGCEMVRLLCGALYFVNETLYFMMDRNRMMMEKSILIAVWVFFIAGCSPRDNMFSVQSPNGRITLQFAVADNGQPSYSVRHNDTFLIFPSTLGFQLQAQDPMMEGFEVIKTDITQFEETWPMPWGEQREVLNAYGQLVVELKEQEATNRLMNLQFRVFDDGIGFRYHFPTQPAMQEMIITDEITRFNLTGNHKVWWIPGDWDIYEHLYTESKFTEIDAIAKRNHPNLSATYIPENAVNTPVTMVTKEGYHLSFHEANLTDYAGMTLKVDPDSLRMESELVGSERTGYKVKRTLPFHTPWRTIQISTDAAGLIESKLVLNLNEPNKLGDVSWFKPMKYNGIWWEMHLGTSTWDFAGTQDMNTYVLGQGTGLHGATTENAKRYIDFAAANNLTGILVEGWNTGWERWIGFEDREGVFDFVTPYPDYDLKEVVRYGREKGVDLIMHHETSAAPRTYEQQLDTAYRLMSSLGIHSVKTGYVGKIIPKGEYHHGQWMVNHYRKVLETAAKYNIAINAHEPIKATGIRRTFPNAISREGLRGQEFNAWATDGGNPPDHLPIVAFTRMLAGPIDFTPGAFKIKLDPYKPENQINTTLAQQLALYVVIYSPIQMACDLPEHYQGQPAMQFIRDVGVDWDKTVVTHAAIGDYVAIARKERGTGNWFVGGITDEQGCELEVNFDFLDPGVTFHGKVYKDGADAHWDENPLSLDIEEMELDSSSKLKIQLAPGGGFAISLMK